MSIDVKMAWRNIWRNPRRTILTICAIAFASLLLVFMLSFQFGSYETMINTSVKIHTGHLQIQADEYQEKKAFAGRTRTRKNCTTARKYPESGGLHLQGPGFLFNFLRTANLRCRRDRNRPGT